MALPGDEVGSAKLPLFAGAPDVGLMDGRKWRVAVIEKKTDADRRSTQLDPLDCVLVKVGLVSL